MANARELLEQADALMRRNRKRGRDKGEGPPTLTDALVERTSALAPTIVLPDATRADPIALPNTNVADPIALDTLSDLPVLTDVVDVWPSTPDVPNLPVPEGVGGPFGLDEALEADALGSSTTAEEQAARVPSDLHSERSPLEAAEIDDTSAKHDRDQNVAAAQSASAHVAASDIAEVEATDRPVSAPEKIKRDGPAAPPPPDEEFILDIPPTDERGGSAASEPQATPYQSEPEADSYPPPEPPPVIVPGSPDWNAMAEEIRMQVLQRLDLFTDTGMRDQLGARLQPIVNRASAELIETINRELGELVRGYVADAIEREIESWRKRNAS
jgi:hypothetical protein